MKLFGKKKKSEETPVLSAVKILGSGCAACNTLEANTVEALKLLELDTSIEHVKDFVKIAQYGVMSTPALVVDEEVLCAGSVLDVPQIVALIRKKRSLA